MKTKLPLEHQVPPINSTAQALSEGKASSGRHEVRSKCPVQSDQVYIKLNGVDSQMFELLEVSKKKYEVPGSTHFI